MAARKTRSKTNNGTNSSRCFCTEIKTVKTQGRITPVKGKIQVRGTKKISHLPPSIFHSAFFYHDQKSAVCFAYALCDLFKI